MGAGQGRWGGKRIDKILRQFSVYTNIGLAKRLHGAASIESQEKSLLTSHVGTRSIFGLVVNFDIFRSSVRVKFVLGVYARESS